MSGVLAEMSGSHINSAPALVALPSDTAEKSSLVDLKNGKVIFKQKPMSLDKQSETLQEIVQFREMLEQRIEKQEPPLNSIPEDHKPVIAKLAHESDKAINALSKYILNELLPVHEEDDANFKSASVSAVLPLSVIESAVKSIMTRTNYGLDAPVPNGKAPAAVCVWRWEVKDRHRDWLPKNVREKAENRLNERIRAKRELAGLFGALSQEQRDAIMDPKGLAKSQVKDGNATVIPQAQSDDPTVDSALPVDRTSPERKVVVNDENSGNTPTTKVKKTIDPEKAAEKAAKEKEKNDKKAAKAEKEQRAKEAQSKSRSIMANFFAKPKAAASRTPVAATMASAVAGPSKVESDFAKSFRPFVLKKDAYLAPVNFFHTRRSQKEKRGTGVQNGDVIVIDDEGEDVSQIATPRMDVDVASLSVREHLRSVLASLPPPLDKSRPPRPSHKHHPFKTFHPLSVRDILTQLSEAEVSGDVNLVRDLSSTLCDRNLLPAKVFIFTEDARPGYFGTWTRNSRIIGPRTPFVKDLLVFDYGYDSGEEWEDEGVADDVAEDGEDEDGDADDADSDLDSWLVDDDEEVEVMPADNEGMVPPDIDFPVPVLKRKAEDGEKKGGKKRKMVVPLVPFAKGPCWETTIGQCNYEPFKQYRIHLFNDTPMSVDPFSFVSRCIEDSAADKKVNSDAIFVKPSIPERLLPKALANTSLPASKPPIPGTSSLPLPGASSAITGTAVLPMVTAPRKASTPKWPFPEIHMPLLLQKITALQAPTVTLLVESIYQDMRVHNIKKNAIEAKVREIAERSKEKKFWVVRQEVLAAYV